MKTCKNCGQKFEVGLIEWKRFCTLRCANNFHHREYMRKKREQMRMGKNENKQNKFS